MDEADRRRKRLLEAGLGDGPDDHAAAASEAWTPPSAEELAGVFPHIEVLQRLGRGGMGAVYKARQTRLERIVALKLLAPHLGADAAFVARFRREALALARLAHPSIVALHDVGEAAGWHYLVMEYVEGATLRHVLDTGAFSPSAVLTLVRELCDALAYAHAQGVVHRDLKPENILMDAQGHARIADFGLAKLRGAERADDSITRAGELFGTAAYMAPEQLAGLSEVDHRADLYALGVVLYEMLTGRLPLGRFEPPSRQVRVDVRIDEVVLRALERTPEQRWQSADEVRRAMSGLGEARRRSPLIRFAAATLLAGIAVVGGIEVGLHLEREADAGNGRVGADSAGTAATTPSAVIAVRPVVAPPTAVEPAPAPASATSPSTVVSAVGRDQGTSAAPEPIAEAAAPPPVDAEPAVVKPAPAQEPAVPPMATCAGRDLAISGAGEVTIDADEHAADLSDLGRRGIVGLALSVTDASGRPLTRGDGAVDDTVLQLRVSAARLHLLVPPTLIGRIRHHGPGRLHVRGLKGGRLVIETDGTGAFDASGLAFTAIDIRHRAAASASIAGSAATLLAVVDTPESRGWTIAAGDDGVVQGFDPSATTGHGLDARALAAPSVDATVLAHSTLKLAGRIAQLRLSLTDGSVEGGATRVEHADVTLTGSGEATLGDIDALDATCTGTGHLRYTGSPRLGRIVTDP